MSVGHTEQRLMALVQTLLDATAAGRVNWTTADDSGTAFKTNRSPGSVIVESDDRDGVAPFTVTLFNDRGNRVESLTTGYESIPDAEGQSSRRGYPWNALWRKLYEAARGRALRIDTVIDALIEDLETNPDDDIPF
jgi:hypothetical protein